MDRSTPSAAHRPAAVRTAGSAALDLLLSAAAGERGEHAPDASARPVVHEAPVFRQPKDGRRTGDKSQTRATADAHSGYRSALRQTQLEPSGTGSRNLSIPASRRHRRKSKSRREHRYYVHSDAGWLSLSGRGDGLVQPLCAELGAIQCDGNRLLSGRASRGLPLRPTRNLELRSGLTVYFRRLLGSAEEARDFHQHGWARPRTRQRFHRTAVALAQVRTDLSGRLRHRPRSVSGAGKLFPLLQQRTATPGAGLTDSGRLLSPPTQTEARIVVMGALPPNPRDLPLLFSRMDAFCFTQKGSCRTIVLLARRIGLSRDGTRAPMQVRNGWRPSGRPSDQPAAPSQNGRLFVEPMGSISELLAN